MSIKERRHRKHKPTVEWGWTDSSSFVLFFFGSKLDEAAGLLATDGLLTTCNVWKESRGLYICCLIFVEFDLDLALQFFTIFLLPGPQTSREAEH